MEHVSTTHAYLAPQSVVAVQDELHWKLSATAQMISPSADAQQAQSDPIPQTASGVQTRHSSDKGRHRRSGSGLDGASEDVTVIVVLVVVVVVVAAHTTGP